MLDVGGKNDTDFYGTVKPSDDGKGGVETDRVPRWLPARNGK